MHLLLVALGIVVYVFFFMGVTDDLTYSAVPIWGYVAFSSCVFVLIWRTVHKSDCRIVRRRIKKDKKWLRQRNWLKDAGTLSVESSLAANLRYPWLSIRSKVCALTQTLPSFWWYAPTCTFVLNHSWFLTRLPSPPPLFFSLFHITFVCRALWIFLLWTSQ